MNSNILKSQPGLAKNLLTLYNQKTFSVITDSRNCHEKRKATATLTVVSVAVAEAGATAAAGKTIGTGIRPNQAAANPDTM